MVVWVGWIKSRPKDLARLRMLGVKGKMIYNGKMKCFEYCSCTEEVMERLIKEYDGFWPGCFTGVDDKTDEQLPHHKQKYWKRG